MYIVIVIFIVYIQFICKYSSSIIILLLLFYSINVYWIINWTMCTYLKIIYINNVMLDIFQQLYILLFHLVIVYVNMYTVYTIIYNIVTFIVYIECIITLEHVIFDSLLFRHFLIFDHIIDFVIILISSRIFWANFLLITSIGIKLL